MHSSLSLCPRIAHSIIVPFVWLIMFAIVAGYNRYIFFNDSFLSGGLKALKYIVSIIFYFSTIMAIICHTLTIITDPGTLDYEIVSQLNQTEKTLCGKCQKERPLRAHHCSTCNRCFMKMDHHCPWVFNCVGFANQKVFFLFISYTLIGVIVAIIMFVVFLCSGSFKDLIDTRKNSRNLDLAENNMRIFGDSFKKLGDILMVIFSLVISVFTLCAVIALFFSQIFLITRNITNIENDMYSHNQNNNPFYGGTNRCLILNILLGLDQVWTRFLPIFEPNKYNGGYIYEIPPTY